MIIQDDPRAHETCKSDEAGRCEKLSRLPDDNRETWKAMNVVSRAKFMVNHCTIEPMFGCYIITSVLTSICTQNLNLQKACRVDLMLNDTVCTALETQSSNDYADEEVLVQQLVADMMIWKTVVQSSVPAILIMFVGSWSDRNRRRKPCMLIPIVGELLSSLGLLVCTYYFYELSVNIVGLVECIPPAITGGWMTMNLAVFSYIGDVSSVKYRTLRIGIANVFYSVSLPIGIALSGVLFQELRFYGLYIITAVLYVLAITYGMVFIEESKPECFSECDQPPKATSCLYLIKDFFDLSNIKEAVEVTFKKGQHNKRLRIILLMVVVFVVTGPLYGEMSMMYMFTRVKFNWTEMDYSLFSTFAMVTNLLGIMFSVGVFSHMLGIDDALIGVMSCVSKILAGFVYAYAPTENVFYLAPLVEIINGTSFIAMRSIISKLVPSDELGKVNSIFGVCEALVPLIYGPMYIAVYKATLKTFPGSFFLFGGALTAPAVIIFLQYGRNSCSRLENTGHSVVDLKSSEENQDVTVLDIEDDSMFDDRKNDGKKHVHFSEETITVMIPNPPKGFCDSVKKLLDFVCCCGCCFPNYL